MSSIDHTPIFFELPSVFIMASAVRSKKTNGKLYDVTGDSTPANSVSAGSGMLESPHHNP